MQHFKNTIKEIHTFLESELILLRETLKEFLSSDINIINDIQTFIDQHPGKLLRPIFTILSAKLNNYNGNNHIKLAAAIECIHLATLLHDDVIDNSTIRHNQPAINILWDNKSAILMGDYLFSKAFQLMVKTNSMEVLDILSNSSTVISKGELNQLENLSNIDLTEEMYYSIITSKTACLFQSATKVGTLVSTTDINKVKLLSAVGLNFGIAYQIIDDINDYSFENSSIGKNPGDDILEGKVTLPLIIALKEMNSEEKAAVTRIIHNKNKTQDDISAILKLLNKYNALLKSKNIANNYTNTAIQNLNKITEESNSKKLLIKLLTSLIK